MRRPVIHVGNDVVDLEDPRTFGKAGDERFTARVLDPAGLAAVRGAEDPDLELWCRWAAKEAAYKVVSKLAGEPPPFVHRAFVVAWDRSETPVGTGEAVGVTTCLVRSGGVTHEGRPIPVRVMCHFEAGRRCAVHALAVSNPTADSNLTADSKPTAGARQRGVTWGLDLLDRPSTAWSGPLDDLMSRFSERELDAVRTRRSAAVRLAARASVAERLGVAEERIEIVCDPGTFGRRPPRVLLDGAPADADVSLSHDGRWIAWSSWTSGGPLAGSA